MAAGRFPFAIVRLTFVVTLLLFWQLNTCFYIVHPSVLKFFLSHGTLKRKSHGTPSTKSIKITFIVLQGHTFIHVFMGSILSFYLCKNHKSSQMLHTGPLKHSMDCGSDVSNPASTLEAARVKMLITCLQSRSTLGPQATIFRRGCHDCD